MAPPQKSWLVYEQHSAYGLHKNPFSYQNKKRFQPLEALTGKSLIFV
jgi:hypothetical protein